MNSITFNQLASSLAAPTDRIPERWPRIPAALTLLVFTIQTVIIAGHGSFRLALDLPVDPGVSSPTAFSILDQGPFSRRPGYRAIVAVEASGGSGWVGVAALQVVLATLAAMRLGALAQALGGPAAGLMAVTVYVFNPDQLLWHDDPRPDSLYASMVILTLAAIHAAWSRPTLGRLAAALTWSVGAGLLDPSGYLLVPIALGFWSIRRETIRTKRWGVCFVVVASFAGVLVLLPMVQEATLAGRSVMGRPDRAVVIRDCEESWLPMPAERGLARSNTPSGWIYAVEHPRECLHLAALRVVTDLAHVRPHHSLRHNIASMALLIPIYALAALGLASACRSPVTCLLAACVAVHMLVITRIGSDRDGRSLFFLLPLIAVLAARGVMRVRWPRKAILPLGMAAVLLAIFHAPLLGWFALQFRADDPTPSDALVLLLGGGPDRPEKAAELYRRGLGSRILLGSDPDLECNRNSLLAAGVLSGSIVSLGPTIGTREEAWRVRDYLKKHPEIRRITIVTTAFHSARARWIFRRILITTGVDVHAAASTDHRFNETNWYTTADGVRSYSQEVLKGAYAYLTNIR